MSDAISMRPIEYASKDCLRDLTSMPSLLKLITRRCKLLCTTSSNLMPGTNSCMVGEMELSQGWVEMDHPDGVHGVY